MKIIPITSHNNALLKKIRGLHTRSMREKLGLFLLEGDKLVNEAFAKKVQIQDVVVSQSFLKEGLAKSYSDDIATLLVVDDKEFKELVTTEVSCGMLAVAEIPKVSIDQIFTAKTSLIVIANGIQDPGNLGTIIRTALASNANSMILTKGTVDPYNPKVVRSASGALFALPIVCDIETNQALVEVKKKGMRVIACDPKANKPFWQIDMTQSIALIFGNEGQGLSSDIFSQCDDTAAIPMNNASESLNVAISTAIVLYEAVKQRWQNKHDS